LKATNPFSIAVKFDPRFVSIGNAAGIFTHLMPLDQGVACLLAPCPELFGIHGADHTDMKRHSPSSQLRSGLPDD
jgi:hypothetical protein